MRRSLSLSLSLSPSLSPSLSLSLPFCVLLNKLVPVTSKCSPDSLEIADTVKQSFSLCASHLSSSPHSLAFALSNELCILPAVLPRSLIRQAYCKPLAHTSHRTSCSWTEETSARHHLSEALYFVCHRDVSLQRETISPNTISPTSY